MVPVVGQVDSVVGPHGDSMSTLEQPFAPGAEEISLAVEDDDGMLSPAEDIDAVFSVHAYGGDLPV
jgi:hypothetical protein